MNKLAKQLIKLGHTNPELRRHLTLILDKISSYDGYWYEPEIYYREKCENELEHYLQDLKRLLPDFFYP